MAFLNSSFTTTLATAGTALLSLSFVFAVTTQEVLGSCIFLFVKHPYDVGDRVDINGTYLTVERISLLFTVFRIVNTHKTTQAPNIVLNTVWIENVSRSKAMREQLSIFISFDTSLEDIQLLKSEMQKFVLDKENSRDFQPEVVVEVLGIAQMNQMELKVEILHKSNWANETVRAARRSKFMCALVLALRKVPIYAPGGGGSPLGDPSNPSYSVAVGPEVADAARDKAAAAKEAKRMVPTKQPEETKSPVIKSPLSQTTSNDFGLRFGSLNSRTGGTGPLAPSSSEQNAIDSLNARDPTADFHGPRKRSASSVSRNGPVTAELDEVRGIMQSESDRGRRKAGETTTTLSPTASGAAAQPQQLNLTTTSSSRQQPGEYHDYAPPPASNTAASPPSRTTSQSSNNPYYNRSQAYQTGSPVATRPSVHIPQGQGQASRRPVQGNAYGGGPQGQTHPAVRTVDEEDESPKSPQPYEGV